MKWQAEKTIVILHTIMGPHDIRVLLRLGKTQVVVTPLMSVCWFVEIHTIAAASFLFFAFTRWLPFVAP